MITMKFGGTSVQDAAAVANVVGIVERARNLKPVVIISAIAQATNMLETAGKLAAEGNPGRALETLDVLFSRHTTMVDTLIRNVARREELREILATSLAELQELVKGVAILRELTPRALDAFYCYGELLSSRIVAASLREHGMDAVWIDTRDFMVTDDQFNRAAPLMHIVEERLSDIVPPLISRGAIPVTQGFIGATQSGWRTTMGRESSDFSASIIGAALGVSDIQIWTDVDGILTADPRVVTSPCKVKVLSFDEAFELSYFGAKVLHPNTMLPALERNIPIHIYNSRRPHLSGSMVTSIPVSGTPVVKSIAARHNITLLTLTPLKRFGQFIFWEHLYNVLTTHGVRANLTATSEYSVAVAIDAASPVNAIAEDLRDVGKVEIMLNKAILCVAGTNIREAPVLLARLFTAIERVPVTMVSFGASPSNISFLVDAGLAGEVVQKLHREFFESSPDPQIFEILDHH